MNRLLENFVPLTPSIPPRWHWQVAHGRWWRGAARTRQGVRGGVTAGVRVPSLCARCRVPWSEMAPQLTVRTSCGALGGKLTAAVTGETARAFLNIPYCSPPVGALRFKEPQPPLPWGGIRDATVYGKEPVQRDEGRLPFQVPRGDERDQATGLPAYMGEDSLSLNIFAPVREPAGGPLPVLFYIYGGGFNNGAGSLPMYDGTRLANRQGGAVVVTINYRLGGLGFLCLFRTMHVHAKQLCTMSMRLCHTFATGQVQARRRYPRQPRSSRHACGSALGAEGDRCVRRRR